MGFRGMIVGLIKTSEENPAPSKLRWINQRLRTERTREAGTWEIASGIQLKHDQSVHRSALDPKTFPKKIV